MKKIIIGISGTSEVIIAKRLLEVLKKKKDIETHLVISKDAKDIIKTELGIDVKDIEALADIIHEPDNFFSPIASGSFKTDAMVVVPCSMKSLSGIANGFSTNLLLRAADVMLKERRKLVLVTRETPLNLIHINNMKMATEAGAIILPPVLSTYSKPKSIEDMVNHIVGKILDALEIENDVYRRWSSDE